MADRQRVLVGGGRKSLRCCRRLRAGAQSGRPNSPLLRDTGPGHDPGATAILKITNSGLAASPRRECGGPAWGRIGRTDPLTRVPNTPPEASPRFIICCHEALA